MILFVSTIFQRCVAPFPNECEERLGTKWFQTSKVDTVLELSLVAMVGMGFLVLGSDGARTDGQDMFLDIVILIGLGASVLFWLVAIRFASVHPCDDCPRFLPKALEIYQNLSSSLSEQDDDDIEDKEQPSSGATRILEDVPLDDIRFDDAPVSGGFSNYARPPISVPRMLPMETKALKKRFQAEEIVLGCHDRKEPWREIIYRQDSNVSNLGDDHTDDGNETVLEEVWVDSETGEEVMRSSGKWTDADTGIQVM